MIPPHPSKNEIIEKLEDLKSQLEFEKLSVDPRFSKKDIILLSARLTYLITTIKIFGSPVYPPKSLKKLLETSKLIINHVYEKKPQKG